MTDPRRFPRAAAPVLYRSAGLSLRKRGQQVTNLSLGGMRVYTDDALAPGCRLDLSLFLPGGEEIRCSGQVVWVTALDAGAPAAFDVGIRFTDLAPEDTPRLASLLTRATESGSAIRSG